METIEAIQLGFLILNEGVPYVERLIANAKQNKELTPEQEAEFTAKIAAYQRVEGKPEWWKTDSERGLSGPPATT